MIYFLLFTSIVQIIFCEKLEHLNSKLIFNDLNSSTIAAFSDVNADRFVDILIIPSAANRIDILISDDKGKLFKWQPFLEKASSEVLNVIPADFDGDALTDVLVTYKNKEYIKACIYFGNENDKVVESTEYLLSETLNDQPFIFDFNGDMYPDVLGEVSSENQRTVWLSQSNTRNFTTKSFPNTNKVKLKNPQSSAFLDINNDYAADIVLTTEKNYEYWYNINGNWDLNHTVSLPNYKIIGQSSFVDICQNSIPEHIIPVCSDDKCEKSEILLYDNKLSEWKSVLKNFKHKDETWGFYFSTDKKYPITLRVGDYNADGYPDLIAVLYKIGENKKDLISQAFLFKNVECSDICRCFEIEWSSALSNINFTFLATFFDYKEDGILDILTVSNVDNPTTKIKEQKINIYENLVVEDVSFMKVLVTSGLCYKDCVGRKKPFGVNVPGPSVRYDTVNINNQRQQGYGGQLSQSSHFALQLPYVHFGLGRTPNFLDTLEVGIPMPTDINNKPIARVKKFTTIIPNSKVYIIPYPINSPNSWTSMLFVDPGNKVLITGGALLGTCIFVAAIVGALHWKERRDDKKEKRQEANKFHFDAM